MNYGEFMTAVLEELGTDATRRGIESLRARAARDALIDLQRFIRAYRQGHATVYTANDLQTKTHAMIGPLPAHAKPKAFYIYQVATAPAAVTDEDVTSWAELMAVETVALGTGTIKTWIEESTGIWKVTQLRAGTDATDTASGVARPDDYDATSNARVWYQASS